MADLLFVLAVVAFFALAALLLHWCDRLVGPDDPTDPGDPGRGSVPAGTAGAER